jgi:hypothetical protein
LLVLVLLLGLVIIAMIRASNPRNWAWFAAMMGARQETAPAAAPPEQSRFPIARPPSQRELIDAARERPREEVLNERVEEIPRDPDLEGVFSLTPEQAAAIVDDTIFRTEEAEGWFRLLKILRQNEEATLDGKAAEVTYTQLFAQPGECRGKLVRLHGIVRRANPLPTPRNQDGFQKYWQLWFFPDDNPSSPVVVYCLTLPPGFPTGMAVEANGDVTGFFFKRWAYNAWNPHRQESTLTSAPVVLAKTVEWRPLVRLPQEKPSRMDLRSLAMMIAAALLASLVVVFYVYRKTRRGRHRPPDSPVDLDSLLRTQPQLEPSGAGQPQDNAPLGE